MTINKRLGTIIRARRIILGYSQSDLARTLGITFQQVQKYEKGRNAMNVERLLQVAKALHIDPEAILHNLTADADATPAKSDRAELEMMKRFRLLEPAEQAAIIAFIKTLCAERKAS